MNRFDFSVNKCFLQTIKDENEKLVQKINDNLESLKKILFLLDSFNDITQMIEFFKDLFL